MRAYVIRRLLLVPVTLIIISVIVFIFMRAVPGDAADVRCGAAGNFDQQCFEAVRQELGICDEDITFREDVACKARQYFQWLGDIITRGDFGYSVSDRSDINEELGDRLWNTVQLGLFSITFTLLIGIPVGVVSAIRSGGVADYLLRFFAILGISVPNFWLATLVVIFPAVWWGVRVAPDWVGWDEPWTHLQILSVAAVILALAGAGTIARIVRSSMLEVLRSDHVRTARAKGLREDAVVTRHVFRNSMITLFTIVGLQFSIVLGGAVIIESIFNIPGMGLWIISAIGQRDFMIIQGVVMVIATWFLLITLIVDVMYAWVDPRIRY